MAGRRPRRSRLLGLRHAEPPLPQLKQRVVLVAYRFVEQNERDCLRLKALEGLDGIVELQTVRILDEEGPSGSSRC